MIDKQRTIKNEISLSGHGLHTGKQVTLTFKPAKENFGYQFQRIDLEGKPKIKALAEFVTDTSRSTVIEHKGARVSTIEHVLSAAYGLGVDNLLIEINGPETPILDGSAKFYVEALLKVGFEEQDADRKYFDITKNIKYENPEKSIEIIGLPDDRLNLNVMIDYNSEVLGNQYAFLSDFEQYEKEIAPSKTFVFFKELEFLLKQNLIKGGDLDNALVIIEKKTTQEECDRLADLFGKEHTVYNGQGIFNDKDLIFPNEPARHKLLDLIGDLALSGRRIRGKIIATRPGHFSNVQFVKILRERIKKFEKNQAPVIDWDTEPIYDIHKIKSLLPHRYPFLLVDKILELSDTSIIGAKNVTSNEEFFNGHFPSEPVMPGVLIVESMAQTGGLLVLSMLDEPEKYSTYFLKIDKVKFKHKVIPGNVLVSKLELLSPFRRGVANMKAQAFVGETLVAEGELMAQVIKTK